MAKQFDSCPCAPVRRWSSFFPSLGLFVAAIFNRHRRVPVAQHQPRFSRKTSHPTRASRQCHFTRSPINRRFSPQNSRISSAILSTRLHRDLSQPPGRSVLSCETRSSVPTSPQSPMTGLTRLSSEIPGLTYVTMTPGCVCPELEVADKYNYVVESATRGFSSEQVVHEPILADLARWLQPRRHDRSSAFRVRGSTSRRSSRAEHNAHRQSYEAGSYPVESP